MTETETGGAPEPPKEGVQNATTEQTTGTSPGGGQSTGDGASNDKSVSGIQAMVRDEVERALSGMRRLSPFETTRGREDRIAQEVEEATGKILPQIADTVKAAVKTVEEAPKKLPWLRRQLWGDAD
jgi:hypothetical protein